MCAAGGVDGWSWPAYLDELEAEAERARAVYDLVLIPGVELTDNAADPDDSAHALALSLRRYVSVERGIVDAILARDVIRLTPEVALVPDRAAA
jgi:hypothetical protein